MQNPDNAMDSKQLAKLSGWTRLPQEIKDQIFELCIEPGSTIAMVIHSDQILKPYTRKGLACYCCNNLVNMATPGGPVSPDTIAFHQYSTVNSIHGLLGIYRQDGTNFAMTMFARNLLYINISTRRSPICILNHRPFVSLSHLRRLANEPPNSQTPSIVPDLFAACLKNVHLRLSFDYECLPDQSSAIERLLGAAKALTYFQLSVVEDRPTSVGHPDVSFANFQRSLTALFAFLKKTLIEDQDKDKLERVILELPGVYDPRVYLRKASMSLLPPESKEGKYQWTLGKITDYDTRPRPILGPPSGKWQMVQPATVELLRVRNH